MQSVFLSTLNNLRFFKFFVHVIFSELGPSQFGHPRFQNSSWRCRPNLPLILPCRLLPTTLWLVEDESSMSSHLVRRTASNFGIVSLVIIAQTRLSPFPFGVVSPSKDPTSEKFAQFRSVSTSRRLKSFFRNASCTHNSLMLRCRTFPETEGVQISLTAELSHRILPAFGKVSLLA